MLLDDAGAVVHDVYLRTAGRPIEVVQQGLAELERLWGRRVEIQGVGTTGSGRELIAEFVGADVVNDEITAHKTGAVHISRTLGGEPVDTIFEIGGQDSKFISIESGVVVDFAMNEACAAGTGSFLEEQAEKLGISIQGEFAALAQDRDPVLVVRDGKREAVARASAWVAAGTIPHPPDGPTNGHAVIHRSLDDRKVEEGGDVGSKLGIVLGARRHGIALIRALDDAGRQCRVHGPRRRLGDENERVAGRAEVAAECVPQFASLRVRAADDDQRSARRRQSGPHCIQYFPVRVPARFIGAPKRNLIGDNADSGHAANGAE